MTIRIKNSSRLIHSKLLLTGDVEFWDLPEYPTIEPREDDSAHEVTFTDRIDSIAMTYYGDPNLWWVIALANNLRILPGDISVGQVLKIPSSVYVRGVLLRAKEK